MAIRVAPHERERGYLDEGKVEGLLKAISVDGYALLLDALPAEALDHIARRLDFDAAHQIATARDELRGVFGHGHLQLGLPRTGDWVLPSLVRNPYVECAAPIPSPPLELRGGGCGAGRWPPRFSGGAASPS